MNSSNELDIFFDSPDFFSQSYDDLARILESDVTRDNEIPKKCSINCTEQLIKNHFYIEFYPFNTDAKIETITMIETRKHFHISYKLFQKEVLEEVFHHTEDCPLKGTPLFPYEEIMGNLFPSINSTALLEIKFLGDQNIKLEKDLNLGDLNFLYRKKPKSWVIGHKMYLEKKKIEKTHKMLLVGKLTFQKADNSKVIKITYEDGHPLATFKKTSNILLRTIVVNLVSENQNFEICRRGLEIEINSTLPMKRKNHQVYN